MESLPRLHLRCGRASAENRQGGRTMGEKAGKKNKEKVKKQKVAKKEQEVKQKQEKLPKKTP